LLQSDIDVELQHVIADLVGGERRRGVQKCSVWQRSRRSLDFVPAASCMCSGGVEGTQGSRGLASNPVLQEHLIGKRERVMHLRMTTIAY